MGTGDVDVVVACRHAADLHCFRNIREWSRQTQDAACRGAIRRVDKASDLRTALRRPAGQLHDTIVVATGYSETEAREQLSRWAPAGMEAIIVAGSHSGGSADTPSASLFELGPVVAGGDPMPFLRKAVLRLRVRRHTKIRLLETEGDLRGYFALRYRVWKDLGYIPPETDCSQSQWEVDYTDRTAEPVGVFAADGELIGCARLVHELGADNRRLVRLIDSLLRERSDPCLVRNFAYPRAISHPYDILESFPRFRQYYQRMVRQGTPKAEVSRVIVKPENRRAGLGEVIVDSLVSFAVCEQIKVLFLACLAERQGFYERCGFRAVPDLECDAFVNVRVPAIAMDRRLD